MTAGERWCATTRWDESRAASGCSQGVAVWTTSQQVVAVVLRARGGGEGAGLRCDPARSSLRRLLRSRRPRRATPSHLHRLQRKSQPLPTHPPCSTVRPSSLLLTSAHTAPDPSTPSALASPHTSPCTGGPSVDTLALDLGELSPTPNPSRACSRRPARAGGSLWAIPRVLTSTRSTCAVKPERRRTAAAARQRASSTRADAPLSSLQLLPSRATRPRKPSPRPAWASRPSTRPRARSTSGRRRSTAMRPATRSAARGAFPSLPLERLRARQCGTSP